MSDRETKYEYTQQWEVWEAHVMLSDVKWNVAGKSHRKFHFHALAMPTFTLISSVHDSFLTSNGDVFVFILLAFFYLLQY